MQYYSGNVQQSEFHDQQRFQYQQNQNFGIEKRVDNYYDSSHNAQLDYSQNNNIYSHDGEYYNQSRHPHEHLKSRDTKENPTYALDSYVTPSYHPNNEDFSSKRLMQMSHFSDNRHSYNNEQNFNSQKSYEAAQQNLGQMKIRDDYQHPHIKESQRYPNNFKNDSIMADPQPSHQDHAFSKTYHNSEFGSRQHDPQPMLQQPKTYGEPIRLHEIGKPQVLAKTSGDGDAVAVFGVVAQVEKSPTSKYPPTGNHFSGNQQRSDPVHSPSYGGSSRTHHLTPIMEQPSASSVAPQNFDYNTQQQNFSRGGSDNRNSVHYSKPDSNEFIQRNHLSADFERHREIYRDEYTDSGYGSTLTERSYEGPMHKQAQFRPDSKEAYRENLSPDQNFMQQWQKPTYNQPVQANNHQGTYNGRPLNQHDNTQQRNVYSQRPENSNQIRPLNQSFGTNHQQEQHYSGVDDRRTKSVLSMRKMFDKPGKLPLPPTSSSYSLNQYTSNDTREIPPRPRIPSNENRFQFERRSLHEQSYQPNSTTYHSYEHVPQQNIQNHATEQREAYVQRMRSSRDLELSTQVIHSNQRYSDSRSPPGPTTHQSGGYPEKATLPHFQPPPQHSQSMNNLDDLRPQESRAKPFQNSKLRSGYTQVHDNDMVVGVRFEKGNTTPYQRDEQKSVASLSPTSYESSNTPVKKKETENESMKLVEAHQPLKSSLAGPPQGYQHPGQNYHEDNRNQQSIPYPQQPKSANFSENDQSHYIQPLTGYASEEIRQEQSSLVYAPQETRLRPRYVQVENRPPPPQSQSRSNPPPFGSVSSVPQPKPAYIHEERIVPPHLNPRANYDSEKRDPQQSYSRANISENRSAFNSRPRNDYNPEEGAHFQSISPSGNYAPEERPVLSQSYPRNNYLSQENKPPQSHFQSRNNYPSEKAPPFSQGRINHPTEEAGSNHFQSNIRYASDESRPSHRQPSDNYSAETNRSHPTLSQPGHNYRDEVRAQTYAVSSGVVKSASPEFLLEQERASRQEQIDRRTHSKPGDRPSYARETEQNHDQEENYVPDVVKKSYGLFSETNSEKLPPQSSEEWPEPPYIAGPNYQGHSSHQMRVVNKNEPIQLQQPQSYSATKLSQLEGRLPPTGVDNKKSSQRQIPRHPFDPNDDSSSEEVDVDAPTPPPSNKQKQFLKTNALVASSFRPQQRPITTGEQNQQNSRQPGDGDQSSSQLSYQQTSFAARPAIPKKPSRNSLKQNEASDTTQNDLLKPDSFFNDNTSAPLNHKHSKDRARLAQAGKVAKKPPNRSRSSSALTEERSENLVYEISVTSNDLFSQHTSQEITVREPGAEQKKPQAASNSSRSLKEATRTEISTKSQANSKAEVPKKTKLVFKPAPENALKQDNRLPDVKEPANGSKHMPPTYTELLGQFRSHRENAIRSAAEKHDRALKTAQAAVRGSNSSKRDENRDIYNQSKPKSSRDDYSRKDRGRSSGRTRTSPDRHGRSRDRRDISERRERSSERDFDRDNRSRKSEREREPRRSPRSHSPKGRRDEDPYRHSHYHRKGDSHHSRQRNGEPEWVEQYRKKRAGREGSPNKRDMAEDQRRRYRREFDFDEYQRDVNRAVAYNSDFDQPPVRKQLFPSKLMAKGQSKPIHRAPPGNSDWMRNLKEQNRKANRNR